MPRVHLVRLVREPTGETFVTFEFSLIVWPIPSRRRSIVKRLWAATRLEVSSLIQLPAFQSLRERAESLPLGLTVVGHHEDICKERGER